MVHLDHKVGQGTPVRKAPQLLTSPRRAPGPATSRPDEGLGGRSLGPGVPSSPLSLAYPPRETSPLLLQKPSFASPPLAESTVATLSATPGPSHRRGLLLMECH